jgi:hypothetical protein
MLLFFMAILSTLRINGIFYGHLVHFVVTWYIFSILVCCTEKNLATPEEKDRRRKVSWRKYIKWPDGSFLKRIVEPMEKFAPGIVQTPSCTSIFLQTLMLRFHPCTPKTFDRLPSNNWGRCYDHNFLRFSTIFGEKNWRLPQKPILWSKMSIF